ncbi:hypothetical protein [Nonomuraea sp. NPDC003709]|uniref:hypothetical protein n=1 Tax=Nonomuraea sp. NPDC003709 TaxID=3154450 RepID=UPI0033A26BE3
MITVGKLREKYGGTWEISTDLAIGVAAWRRKYLGEDALGRNGVNNMCASPLDELAAKLAAQEAM